MSRQIMQEKLGSKTAWMHFSSQSSASAGKIYDTNAPEYRRNDIWLGCFRCGTDWQNWRLLFQSLSRASSLSGGAFLQVAYNLLVHGAVELIAGIIIPFLIKVVLVDGKRLLTLPFHVLNQALQSPLQLRLILARLIDIPNFLRHVPMPALVDISLDMSSLT